MAIGARHLLDIALGALLLRLILAWLLASRRRLRRLASLVAIVGLSIFLILVDLPVSRLTGLVLLIPLALGLLWSSLPDFANAFRTLTSGRYFTFRHAREADAVAEPLLEALVDLARLRIGALIIRPRSNDVRPFLSGGEEVSAEVNRSLLLSIFSPRAPRHDGAVIVEGRRITRIGAVMPLASAESVSLELGTRHLAALGLSEQCDADVLVVSEERGSISRAWRGQLVDIAPDDAANAQRLGDKLHLSLPRTRSAASHARSALMWVVAASLAVAGSMGFERVRGRLFPFTEEITIVEAPISVVNVPAGFFVADLSATSCHMYVAARRQGPSIDLQEPAKVVVDSKDLPAGENHISLMASMAKNIRPGWRVERFDPPEVFFTLAPLRSLVVKVVPTLVGLNPRFEVLGARSEPSAIRAEVRDPQWSATDHLETLPVELSGVQAPGTYAVTSEINLPASMDISGPRPSKKIRVTVDIHPRGPGTPWADPPKR